MLVAKKNTYAYEDLGDGTLVRRQVMAGQPVPDHYVDFEDKGAVEDAEDFRAGYPHEYTEGVGGTAHDYKRPQTKTARKGAKSEDKND